MPITMSDNLSFEPGFRPIAVVKDQVSLRKLLELSRDPKAKQADIVTLREQAYTVKQNKFGFVELRNHRGMTTFSHLKKDEWESLDAAVIEAVKGRSSAVQDLRSAGLTRPLGGLGTLVSQWTVAAEKVRPVVSMSGRAQTERDRQEKILRSVPVPIIHQTYEIGERELLASRLSGDGLDVSEAAASAREVVEEQERMLFNGDGSIVFGGDTIRGYTDHPDRDTDTATNYGGGAWSTAGNAVATVLGMMAALALVNYYGPYGIYVADGQWYETQAFNANRAGSELEDLRSLADVSFVRPSFLLADGVVIMVQMTSDVVDLATAAAFQTREWNAADESAFYAKVMVAEVPRLKSDASDNIGIAHATGA